MSNFFHLIHQSLSKKANEEVIHWPDGSVTKANELLEDIASIQSSLPNDFSSILLARAFDKQTLSILLACIANGNPVLIFPKHIPLSESLNYFKENEIKYAFVNSILLNVLLRLKQIHSISIPKKTNNTIDIKEVPSEHIALISLSSGSSGKNKSICRTHSILSEQVKAIDLSFSNWKKQNDFPLFANILLYNLSVGKTTYIPDIIKFDINKLNPIKIVEQLKNNKIETLTGNVYYFEKIYEYLHQHKLKIKSVNGIAIGGSPISNLLIEKLELVFPNAKILVVYGSTEAEPISIREHTTEKKPVYYGYAVGKIHEGIELKIDSIYDTNIHNVKISVGEILVKGKHVCAAENQFLRTGDYGYMMNNELYLTARGGNIEHINGFQHLQFEHCIEYNLKIKVAIVIKNNIINVYTENNITLDDIEKLFFITFNIKPIIKIINTKIPKDTRQRSKILYYKLT